MIANYGIKLRCTHCMFCALLVEDNVVEVTLCTFCALLIKNNMAKGTVCILDPMAMQEVKPSQMICDWFEPSTSTQSLYQALEEEGL